MSLLITRNGLGRLAADVYDRLGGLCGAGDPDALHSAYREALNVLEHSSRRETESVLTTRIFAGDAQVRDSIRRQSLQIKALETALSGEIKARYREECARLRTRPQEPEPTPQEVEGARLIPVRAEGFVCPLQTGYLLEKLGEDALETLKLRGNTAYEALNLVDGRRSVTAISRAVSAEYGPVETADVLAFFRILERAGLLRIKST